jgi:6-phosphogluconolactonase
LLFAVIPDTQMRVNNPYYLTEAGCVRPGCAQKEGQGDRMSIKFRRFAGVATVIAAGLLGMSCGTSSRQSGILLAPSQGAALIDSFGVNLNTGVLTQIHTAGQVPAGTAPAAIIVDSTGSTAYVANASISSPTTSPGAISAYTVKSDGTLTSAGSNAATGPNPVALTMDPAGKFLFVVNQGSNDVSVYSIGSPGSVTQVSGSPFPTGAAPLPPSNALPVPAGVAVSSGNFVYIANQGQDTVSAFSLDTATGKLTAIAGSPFAAGTSPTGLFALLTTSNVSVLYVANQGSNNVSAFNINTDGSLTPTTGSPYAAGLGPVALTADPTRAFLYVANRTSNQLTGYKVSPGSGTLTALSPSTVSTGTNPVALSFQPGGNGCTGNACMTNFLYVANIGNNTISGFTMTAQSGALATLPAVTTDSQPSGVAVK